MDKLFIVNFIAILLCWQSGFGCTLQVEINHINRNDIQISCRLDSSDCTVKEIMVLQMLNPKRKPIAILRPNSQVSISNGYERDFQADGHVSKNVSESYLHVTLSKPTTKDSGIYSCVVYYLNETGYLTDMRKNVSFEINDSTQKVMEYMMETISRLETQLQEQKNESRILKEHITSMETKLDQRETDVHLLETKLEEKLKNESILNEAKIEYVTQRLEEKETMLNDKVKDIAKDITGLETLLKGQNRNFTIRENYLSDQVNSLGTDINEKLINQTSVLEGLLKHQEDNLNQLAEKEKYTVAFSFGYSKAIILSKGDVMIFDDYIMNEGQGYEASSGTFTAPRSGYYLFQLSVTLRGTNWMDINLMLNGNPFQTLLVGDFNGDNHSSVSDVIKMEVGDKVNLVVLSRGSPFMKTAILTHQRYSTFSGFLIKAV